MTELGIRSISGALVASIGVYVPLIVYGWYDTYILNNYDPKFGQDGAFWVAVNISSLIAAVIFISFLFVFFLVRKRILKMSKLYITLLSLMSGWLCMGFLFTDAWKSLVFELLSSDVGNHLYGVLASYFALSILICFVVLTLAGNINEKFNK